MWSILLYLGAFLLILYYLYTRNLRHWERKGIPYEKPNVIFGNLSKVVMQKEHFFDTCINIYKKFKTPYVGMYIFNQPRLMVRSPELLRKILVKDFDKFVNRDFATNESVDPLAFHTLFTSRDETWRGLRSKISPVFTSGKMKLMLPLMQQSAEDLQTYLNNSIGKSVDVKQLMKKYAVDVISSCAFGVNANCVKDGEQAEIYRAALQLLNPNSLIRNISVFSFFFFPKIVNIFRLTFLDKKSADYLYDLFISMLNERKEKNIVRNDLIDLLQKLKENETLTDSYKFTDLTMAAQSMSFFSAGTDTTALTISFALYELALNKEVQDRLRDEIRAIHDKHGGFTYEALQEMKYLTMVIDETLRKYPLTVFLNRKTTTDYTFEETGLVLEKDTSVMIPVAGLHYDPEFFPDPEKFNPDRFNAENKLNIQPYTYMPFGEGPRNCIGQRFALLTSKVALACAIKDFAFEPNADTEIPVIMNPQSIFLQNKAGLRLKVVKV